MAHYLGGVHASVRRRDTDEVYQLFSCRVPRRRDRMKVRCGFRSCAVRKACGDFLLLLCFFGVSYGAEVTPF